MVILHLWRDSAKDWVVVLSFENEPPSDSIVQMHRSQIIDAANALGMTVEEA